MRIFIGTRPLGYWQILLGREDDLRRLRNLLLADRVVLLLGRSGTGKTSLVQAMGGLRHRVEQEFPRYQCIDMGHYLDIDTKTQPSLSKEICQFGESLAPSERGLLVVDQVERCFQREDAHERAPRWLAQLGNAMSLFPNVTFLLILQEEYLAQVQLLRHHIPGQLSIQYRLDGFNKKEMERIIAQMIIGDENIIKNTRDELHELILQISSKEQETQEPFLLQLMGWLLEAAGQQQGLHLWDGRRASSRDGAIWTSILRELRRDLVTDPPEVCYLHRCLASPPLALPTKLHQPVLAALCKQYVNPLGGRRVQAASRSALARRGRLGTWFVKQRARLRQHVAPGGQVDELLEPLAPQLLPLLQEWGVLRRAEHTEEGPPEDTWWPGATSDRPAAREQESTRPSGSSSGLDRRSQEGSGDGREQWELCHDRLVPALRQMQRRQDEQGRSPPALQPRHLLAPMLVAIALMPPRQLAGVPPRLPEAVPVASESAAVGTPGFQLQRFSEELHQLMGPVETIRQSLSLYDPSTGLKREKNRFNKQIYLSQKELDFYRGLWLRALKQIEEQDDMLNESNRYMAQQNAFLNGYREVFYRLCANKRTVYQTLRGSERQRFERICRSLPEADSVSDQSGK